MLNGINHPSSNTNFAVATSLADLNISETNSDATENSLSSGNVTSSPVTSQENPEKEKMESSAFGKNPSGSCVTYDAKL